MLISSDDADREWWGTTLSGWIPAGHRLVGGHNRRQLCSIATFPWRADAMLGHSGSCVPRAADAMPGTSGGCASKTASTKPESSGSDVAKAARAIPGISQPSDRWTDIVTAAKWSIGAIGAISGLIAALTGRSGSTPGQPGTPIRGVGKKVLAITGPLFVVCLILMLSWGDTALGELITQRADLFDFHGDRVRKTAEQASLTDSTSSHEWMRFPLVILGLAGVSVIAGCFVTGLSISSRCTGCIGIASCALISALQTVGASPVIPAFPIHSQALR